MPRRVNLCLIVVEFVLLFQSEPIHSLGIDFGVTPLSSKNLTINGDLYIGYLSPLFDHNCKEFSLSEFELIQLIAATIDEVNNSSRLPIRLGLTVYSYCAREEYVLGQAMRFLPANKKNEPRYVAIICCIHSSHSTLVSFMASLFKIPVISARTTADALSKKDTHGYFIRMIPPDKYLVRAMVELIRSFDWNYVSVVYLEGSYGDGAFRELVPLLRNYTICIEHQYRISTFPMTDDDSMSKVARELASGLSRVVILFIYEVQAMQLFEEVRKFNKTFVWITGDGMVENIHDVKGYEDVFLGGMTIRPHMIPRPDLYEFMRSEATHPLVKTRNGWMEEYWEKRFNCSWGLGPLKACSANPVFLNESSVVPDILAAITTDMVETLVLGMMEYIRREMANASSERIRDGFNTSSYLQYLKKVSFNGRNGPVLFDGNGDMLGSYVIVQGVLLPDGRYGLQQVGAYFMSNNSLVLNNSGIEWYAASDSGRAPESTCGRPCLVGEKKIPLSVVCCWKCELCPSNAITRHNQTDCKQCPRGQRPDAETRTGCINIEPTFIEMTSQLSIYLGATSGVGLILTVMTFVTFIRHWNNRLIKSSCREASVVMLLGISNSFILYLAYLGKLTDTRCYVGRFGFHLTFTVIYAPMLVKIVKICRIFESGRRSVQQPRFISIKSQIVIISFLLLVQVCIIMATVAYSQPQVLPFNSVDDETVELKCKETAASFSPSVVYNLALILCCCCLAFKTRKLPANFNESIQIGFCSNTTFILWVAFIPAYLALLRAKHQIILLAVSMMVNGFVSLFSLFLPKFYALYYVSETNLVLDIAYDPTTTSVRVTPAAHWRRWEREDSHMETDDGHVETLVTSS